MEHFGVTAFSIFNCSAAALGASQDFAHGIGDCRQSVKSEQPVYENPGNNNNLSARQTPNRMIFLQWDEIAAGSLMFQRTDYAKSR